MNPDQLAKYFYEQGNQMPLETLLKTKNIDMSVRDNKVNEVAGTKYRVLILKISLSLKLENETNV